MPVNSDKPDLWRDDIARSVALYNSWFIQFAPQTFREARKIAIEQVKHLFSITDNLRQLDDTILAQHLEILPLLRMATAPPIARDRLSGLAHVSAHVITTLEDSRNLPPRMAKDVVQNLLVALVTILRQLLDKDIFPWLERAQPPTTIEIDQAAAIIADRRCGAAADPLIRNAQERRQLAVLRSWLEQRKYVFATPSDSALDAMQHGTFCFRYTVSGLQEDGSEVRIPIDAIIMPHNANADTLPLLIEAKSAGDFANTNKRRKEEAIKVAQLRRRYGTSVQFILFLCGYFDTSYLQYEAAEGIDWIWEHRPDDLALLGV